MRIPRIAGLGLLGCLLIVGAVLPGCRECFSDGGWLDPSTSPIVAPKRRGKPVMPILSGVSEMDPAEGAWPNSTDPLPKDLVVEEKDYAVGATDVLQISVLNLYQEGVPYVANREVSETGFIRLNEISEQMYVAGLTTEQMRSKIADVYREEDILGDPQVDVIVLRRQQNTFNIMGAVQAPGPYRIDRPDMRLLDAISAARDITQPTISYIYVIRQKPAAPKGPPTPTKEAEEEKQSPKDLREKALREFEEALEKLAPSEPKAPETRPQTEPVTPSMSVMETSGGPSSTRSPAAGEATKARNTQGTWVYDPGRKVWYMAPAGQNPGGQAAVAPPEPIVEVAPPAKTPVTTIPMVKIEPPTTQQANGQRPEPTTAAAGPEMLDEEDPFGLREKLNLDQSRLIAIDLQELRRGNAAMNIIMRDKDVVIVPPLPVGEFYVIGKVIRPGAYSLTGRKLNLKQAIAAAGNFSPLAWPKNAYLVRRIGQNQEQIIPLDLDGILRGEKPDMFLKPDDLIAVGSNAAASWMAVIRNAFRMTYGFGFIYDRNFADPLPGGIDSRRFSRW